MMNDLTQITYKSDILDEKYQKITLDCGLQILVFPKKMSTVYALFGVRYGSVNNSFTDISGEEITVPDGIAHFLEHKLFFNEDGSDSFERFSEYGADANAYTSFNKTAYLFSCTDNLDKSLGELLYFVTHPYFTESSVAAEVGIISEEIRMYDDNPSDRCFYGMLEGMYEHHSLRRNICGSESSISKITADTLYKCYSAFYRPDNMVLIVCGDVDAEHVAMISRQHLPKSFIGSSVKKTNDNDKEKRQAFKGYTEQKMQVAKPLFCIGFKDTDIPTCPKERQKKDAVASILDEMLFSSAGELYDSLFERSIISPSLSYGYTISESFAYHSISGEADSPSQVLDEVLAYIDRIKAQGLNEDDFQRAKRVMYSETVRLFDSTESISNALFSFACEDAEIFEYAEIIRGITFDDVLATLNESFDRDTVTLSVVKPL
ncbi:MAG: insulinase family protein [Clostridia bacterium]|nr:insulinase family protein [Clostridia bacterium]